MNFTQTDELVSNLQQMSQELKMLRELIDEVEAIRRTHRKIKAVCSDLASCCVSLGPFGPTLDLLQWEMDYHRQSLQVFKRRSSSLDYCCAESLRNLNQILDDTSMLLTTAKNAYALRHP